MAIDLEAIKRAAETQRAAGVSEADLITYGRNVGLTDEEIAYALGKTQIAPTKTSDLNKALENAKYISKLAGDLGDTDVTAGEALALSDPTVRKLAETAWQAQNVGKYSDADLAAYGKQLGLNQDLIDYLLGTEMNLDTSGKYDIGGNALAAFKKAPEVKFAPAVNPPVKSGDFSTAIRYGDGMAADRTGRGVAVEGDSGLRSGYAPYVQRMLERASAEADVPFQKYMGESPLLESARMGVANLQTPAQFQQGSNLATAAGIGALGYGQYKPTSFITGTFANPAFTQDASPDTRSLAKDFFTNYTGSAPTSEQLATYDTWAKGNPNASFKNAVDTLYPLVNPPTKAAEGGLLSLKKYDSGGNVALGTDVTAAQPSTTDLSGQNITTGQPVPSLAPVNYGGQNVTNVQASYMSPYMQGAIDPTIREAKRQSEMMGQLNAAKAVGQGAFGGSRHGLVEAERQRNLMTQLGDIQGKGLQEAYTQGLGQFNKEQDLGFRAQQEAEKSRQFGAELGLKGLDTSLRAAQTLGSLGTQQGTFDLNTIKQMADMGKDQQQFDYQEFLRGEKYPYENLTFMRNMLTGLPISSADSYQPGGSSDAFITFLQSLKGMETLIPGGAEGGLISGIATLGNDD